MISALGYPPTFLLLADGNPFATNRVLKIEVTDGSGYESDHLTITLDDRAPHIERPREGAKYTLLGENNNRKHHRTNRP